MQPVKMKVYGLFLMSRKAYLLLQTGVFVCMLFAFIGCIVVSPRMEQLGIRAFKYAPWGIVVIAVLELGETVVMLWKFKAKERAARGSD
jgi:hypothetical protein